MGLTEAIDGNREEVTQVVAEVDKLLARQDCARLARNW